jgi:hypothetical protein
MRPIQLYAKEESRLARLHTVERAHRAARRAFERQPTGVRADELAAATRQLFRIVIEFLNAIYAQRNAEALTESCGSGLPPVLHRACSRGRRADGH